MTAAETVFIVWLKSGQEGGKEEKKNPEEVDKGSSRLDNIRICVGRDQHRFCSILRARGAKPDYTHVHSQSSPSLVAEG